MVSLGTDTQPPASGSENLDGFHLQNPLRVYFLLFAEFGVGDVIGSDTDTQPPTPGRAIFNGFPLANV